MAGVLYPLPSRLRLLDMVTRALAARVAAYAYRFPSTGQPNPSAPPIPVPLVPKVEAEARTPLSRRWSRPRVIHHLGLPRCRASPLPIHRDAGPHRASSTEPPAGATRAAWGLGPVAALTSRLGGS